MLRLTLGPRYVEFMELPTTVWHGMTWGDVPGPVRPTEADNNDNDPFGIRGGWRRVFSGDLEEKEGIATSRSFHGDCRVSKLLSLASGELLLTRAMLKSGLMMGYKEGSESRRRKADYRGLNVITYKWVG